MMQQDEELARNDFSSATLISSKFDENNNLNDTKSNSNIKTVPTNKNELEKNIELINPSPGQLNFVSDQDAKQRKISLSIPPSSEITKQSSTTSISSLPSTIFDQLNATGNENDYEKCETSRSIQDEVATGRLAYSH